MKNLSEWLNEYGKSHQNPTNQKIHLVCVPLIFWTILGFLLLAPGPKIFTYWPVLSCLFIFLILSFYWFLSWKAGAVMTVIVAIMAAAFIPLLKIPHFSSILILIFLLSWVAQFIGHKIEGAKPSFLTDILYLLIGPLWVLEEIRPFNKFQDHF